MDASFYYALFSMEPFVFFVSAAVALVLLARRFLHTGNRMGGVLPNPGLGLVRVATVAGLLWIGGVLALAADAGIVGYYTLLYVALAAACLLVASFIPILRLTLRGDIVERANLAAGLAVAGFVIGTAFAFGGALTGQDLSCAPPRDADPVCLQFRHDEPGTTYGYGGWFVVLVFFVLAYIELRAAVKVVHRFGGGIDDAVRLDRDPSAGLLIACTAMACGLVAGRAAAGDFLGWRDGLYDYAHRIWPLALLPPMAALAGQLSLNASNPARPRYIASVGLLVVGVAYYFLT